MIGFVNCSGCGLTGTFPIELKIRYRAETCGSCRHTEQSFYTYHFCATDCLAKWNAKHTTNGVLFLPCQSCGASGDACGFKENGPCKNCEGQGEIGVEHGNVKNAENTARLKQMQAECDATNKARREAQQNVS